MNETYKYFRLDMSESFFLGKWEILFLWNSLSGQKRNIQYFAFYSKSAFAIYIYNNNNNNNNKYIYIYRYLFIIIILVIIIIITIKIRHLLLLLLLLFVFYFRFKDEIEPSMFWEKSVKTILVWNVI